MSYTKESANVSTMAPTVSSNATIPIKIAVTFASRQRRCRIRRKSKRLSDMPIEYEMYSQRNVAPINTNVKITVVRVKLAVAAVFKALLPCTMSAARNACPVLNSTTKPKPAPTRGINIKRQSPKLFANMLSANVPFAWPCVTVWFSCCSIICASFRLGGTKNPATVAIMAITKMKRAT